MSATIRTHTPSFARSFTPELLAGGSISEERKRRCCVSRRFRQFLDLWPSPQDSSCRRVLSCLPLATLRKDILVALFDLAVGWNQQWRPEKTLWKPNDYVRKRTRRF